jgi:uncharacterized protein with NRDE domain
LGLNDSGVFVALTNRPIEELDGNCRSRGLLVNDTLANYGSAAEAARALGELPAQSYNPFNLLVADGETAFAIVYDEKPSVTELPPGPHVIGNADPNDRAHPKVGRILAEAERVATGSSGDALDALAELCRTHLPYEADAPLADRRGDTCVHLSVDGVGAYGTRCSTLLRKANRPEDDVLLWAEGSPCENDYEDRTQLLRDLDRTTGNAAETTTRNVA